MKQNSHRADKPSAPNFQTLPDVAMIDIRAMCQLYGASPATIWRRCRTGEVPAPIRIGKKFTRWQLGAVRDSLAAQVGSV